MINLTRKRKPIVAEYTLKEEPLENVKVASYLGVQLADNLTWHNHIAKVAAKGNKTLGFVRRNIKTSSINTKTLAYQTLVRPTVEYASCIWSPHQKHLRDSIEKIQRRAVRYVCANYEQKASVTSMQRSLEWDTLEQRRMKSIVTMGYKIIHKRVAISSEQLKINTLPTRSNGMKFHRISAQTNYYKFSFFPTLVPLWNSLPPDAALAANLDIFKQRISKHYIKPTYQ